MDGYNPNERDELRGRFTCFLELLIRRARTDYLRKLSREPYTISLEDAPEEKLFTGGIFLREENNAFDFEEERLALAFSKLSLMRQRILTLLFVEGWKPTEIAGALHCSVQYVYNQRYLALKKLREFLEKEGGAG